MGHNFLMVANGVRVWCESMW